MSTAPDVLNGREPTRSAHLEQHDANHPSTEEVLREQTHQLRERVKELRCLYSFLDLLSSPGVSLAAICQGLVDLIPPGWQRPESTCARLTLEAERFTTASFRESGWIQRSPVVVHGQSVGLLEVHFLGEQPESEGDPFLPEEAELLNALAGRLGRTIERFRAEAESRRSEQLFHTLAQVSPVGIFRTDARGECVYVNERWCEIAGVSAERALGQGWVQGIHPEDRERVFAAWSASVREQRPFALEYRFRRPDGILTWVMGQAMQEPSGPDQPGGFVGSITDITDRKNAEDALRLHTQQLEALRAISAEVTRELDLPTLLALITRRAGELLGVFSGATYLWDDTAQVLVLQAEYGEIHPAEQEPRRLGEGLVGAVAQLREGMVLNEYRTSPYGLPSILAHTSTTAALAEPLLYRDRLLGVLALNNRGTSRRFTDRDAEFLRLFAAQAAIAIENARLYEQVRRHAEDLERKVEERTREFQEANAELRAANADLEAFSYSVSHDLRTPLLAIDGFCRLLARKYGSALDAPGQEYLQRVRGGVQRMEELVDALLGLARVGREPLHRESVDLGALAGAILGELRLATRRRAVEVRIQDGLVVQGDARLLRRLLENLLGNAWKFTARTRQPCIEVGSLPGATEPAVYFVRDNGAGFDMAEADKLFQLFQRLHGEEFPGTGIGLATVQRIVQRHGGRIWAEGVVDKGATFFFTVGAARQAPRRGA